MTQHSEVPKATVGVLVSLAALLLAVNRWGSWLADRDVDLVLPVPPLLAEPNRGATWELLLPIATGSALIVMLPKLAGLPWRRLLLVVPFAAAAWTCALTLAEGKSGFTRGPSDHTEYAADVPSVRADPKGFLRTFTDDIEDYEIHVRAHPPGMVLLLAGFDTLDLDIHVTEAVLVIAAASSATAALLIIVRNVADEVAARSVAPFLVLTPASTWIATSADGLYAAIAVWATAAFAIATSSTGQRRLMFSVVGGALMGLGLLGSYGLALAAVAPALVASVRRAWTVMVVGALSGAAVLAALLPFGFWYLDGLAATVHEYRTLDIERPWWYFAFANIAAWSLALGPAVIAGLVQLRDKRMWLAVCGGLGAAALAHVSMLSKGEVERIWLPFTLLVMPAAGALVERRRLWLGAQVITACAIVGTVTTQW